MEKSRNGKVLLCCENTFDELCTLESIIKFTKDACYEQECTANYYNLTEREKLVLSNERNHYINMLTIALDKISKLKDLNSHIESEVASLQ